MGGLNLQGALKLRYAELCCTFPKSQTNLAQFPDVTLHYVGHVGNVFLPDFTEMLSIQISQVIPCAMLTWTIDSNSRLTPTACT